MTDSIKQPAVASKKPIYVAKVLRKYNDGKQRWTTVGAAWLHKDGEGLSVKVDLIICTITIALFKPDSEEDNA